MILPIGAKVRFLSSGELGVVTEQIDEQMVGVYVSAWDMEIPVAKEDLALTEPEKYPGLRQAVSAPSKPAPARQPASAPVPARASLHAVTDTGVQLAFDAVLKGDGTPASYRIFLLNDTTWDIIYTMLLYVGDAQRFDRNGKLSAGAVVELGSLAFDELNDSPEVQADCWRITTDGTGGKHEKDLKIKPKVFFGKLQQAPLLNKPAHVLPLFEKLDGERSSSGNGEDLRAYSKRHAPPAKVLIQAPDERNKHEVREVAEFSPELDLHIEKLVPDASHLNNAEIIQLQLRVFEDYMAKAHRLGFERVFIIHGMGKGRLKDAIASRLIRMPEVLTFKNEYHPKYGYGATEVVFI